MVFNKGVLFVKQREKSTERFFIQQEAFVWTQEGSLFIEDKDEMIQELSFVRMEFSS